MKHDLQSPTETLDMGAMIKSARMNKGLTIRECARRCGVAVQTLHGLETGSSYQENPRLSTINKISAVLEIPIEDLAKGLSHVHSR